MSKEVDFTDLAELISRIQDPDEELPVKYRGLLNECTSLLYNNNIVLSSQ